MPHRSNIETAMARCTSLSASAFDRLGKTESAVPALASTLAQDDGKDHPFPWMEKRMEPCTCLI
jgi:hypothetical protein